MYTKKVFLTLFILSLSNHIILSEQQAHQSLLQWFKGLFITDKKTKKFQEAVTASIATGKPLDLKAFYHAKENQAASSITNPTDSARKFKTAIINSAKKGGIMERFKNSPEKFLLGASSSSYQYEGGLDGNNANAVFYKSKKLPMAGDAINFWNKYKSDIQQMKNELGINSFRLSIAWERVQPDKEVWDISAIHKYVTIIKTLKEYNIEPIVVLHHYTIPQWFAELGGFEKAANITYFVEFAKKMYTALHKDVTYWSTFNAIEGYAFKGYYTLDGPPGTKKSLITTQKVMLNMLSAHAQVYQAIKGKTRMFFTEPGLYQKYKPHNPLIPNPQIGIQKNIVLFDPFENKNTSFCEKKGSQFICGFSSLLNNTMFFKLIRYKYSDLIDWIGLNIYSNMFMLYAERQEETEEDRKTENLNYRDYPEGIYRAVKIINDKIARPLNIPIIITENGIATKNDHSGNEKRTRFFRRALYTIRKLIEEGYPIIGYTPWSSHDNYEWPSQKQANPHDRPYGIFAVDFDNPVLPRTLKEGAEYYRDFIKEYLKKEQ